VLNDAGLASADPWVAPMRYPEKPLTVIAESAARRLGLSPAELLTDCARYGIPAVLQRFSAIANAHGSAISLIDDICSGEHPELRRLLPGSEIADYRFIRIDNYHGRLRVQVNDVLRPIILGLLMGLAEQPRFAMQIEQSMEGRACCFDLSCQTASPT
jgi:hypothetical protein